MRILLYEPHLLQKGGFYSFVYQALQTALGAQFADGPRPLPALKEPREHSSAWIDFDGKLILIDMSDHVFHFDTAALHHCFLYFKTNLHPPTARRVLAEAGLGDQESKLRPFFSFAGYLEEYLRPAPLRALYDRFRGRTEDLCDVVGVYEHLRRDGEISVFAPGGPEPTPSRVHYWARVHTLEALTKAGLGGTLRLTSRYNSTLEDGSLIKGNLSQKAYRRAILRANMLVINTLPHALPPWKVSECLALGRPFLFDIPPLIEFPEPYRLREGDHYLTLLPPADFDPDTPGRVLHRYRVEDFEAGSEKVASALRDPDTLAHLNAHVDQFRREAFRPETLANYLLDSIREAE
ncbi:MAG: hypothetical protein JJU29_07715 [Verrucomicrobia bacterium]|nr:hypothetical protein [Verrucomicrobiota bacterium]MCH8513398.1 hypothetical protein [Kiritimatiellia bacterium]